MSNPSSIEQFRAITGASEDQAKFYIDSAKGDLNAAMATFFESGADDGSTAESPMMPGTYVEDAPSTSNSVARPSSSKKEKSKPSRSGINTFGSLKQSDEDDEDDDKPAEFYTGGEKSGLGVIDPTKKKDGSKKSSNLIQEILRKAAAGGQPAEDDTPQASTFRGSGYTLGGEDEESKKVENPNEAFRKAMSAQPPKVTRILKLWKDGFSVDDGQLYRYDDPANKNHLEAINNGRAPLSLLNVEYGQAVDVSVEKRTDEPYAPPPKVYKPFEGSGHRLGSEPPTASSAGAATTATTSRPTTSTETPPPTMDIDDTQPTTSLQIRLAAGGRLVSQFNTSHTLADVYDFVDRTNSTGGRQYILLTPFPRKEYPKDSTTIAAAGLLKGVLQQKFS